MGRARFWAIGFAGCFMWACGADDAGHPASASSGAGAAGGASASSGAGAAGGAVASSGAGSTTAGSGGSTPVDACSTPIEGYGAVSMGGDGGDEYHVTVLGDGGPGSLRDGVENRSGPRRIVFDVAGTITLADTLRINAPFLTIDGCASPSPGITVTTSNAGTALMGIDATHDIILRNLRLVGLWQPGQPTANGTADLYIDGDANPDHVARAIVVDHVTLTRGNDAAFDVWGEVQDVTLSWSLLYESARGGLVSHYPAPYQIRQRLSYHHNVYSKNIERNPQIRADVRDFDYVNNIVHEWGFFDPPSGYGIRIRNDGTEPPVHGNFVNNAFASSIQPQNAFIDGGTGSQLYLAGNIFPSAFTGNPSTLPAPLPVPAPAQIAQVPADTLAGVVLPLVGVRDRNQAEAALLAEIAAAL